MIFLFKRDSPVLIKIELSPSFKIVETYLRKEECSSLFVISQNILKFALVLNLAF